MRCRNDTGKEVLVRLDDGKGLYIWKVVVPGTILDMPADYAKNLGFALETEGPIEEERDKPISIPPEKPNGIPINSTEEFKIQEPEKEFKDELKQSKGIGPKVLKDILGVFPTKDKLKEAIKSGIELPFNSKIDKILRIKYG